jgi:ribose transport system substrate-binding protein
MSISVVCCAVLALGVLNSSSGATKAGPSVAGKTVAAVMTSSSNDPWSAAANATMQKAWAKAGLKVTFIQTPTVDVATQARQIQQAIALKPDVLMINVLDTNEIIPWLRKAAAAGIPVVDWNGALNSTAQKMVLASINADNSSLGKYAGQAMVEGLQKAGYKTANILAETGTANSAIVQDRMKAFEAELAKHPGYKLVANEDANWNSVTSGQQAAQVLSAWKSKGGIQGAFGMADYMALPIAADAKQLGIGVGWKHGDLVLVASNCTGAGARAMKAGMIYGMADQLPTTQAAIAANLVISYLQGKKVPNMVITPVHPITQANINSYLGPCNY